MRALLELTGDLPERSVEAGTTILSEGDPADAIWILMSGRVLVRKGDLVVASIDEPGAPLGEMAVLLGGATTATVETAAPSRFRVADDGARWLADHGDAVAAIAATLARRLEMVTGYLADLRRQYADADAGLEMIDDVLANLVTTGRPRAEPGSERDPDPLY